MDNLKSGKIFLGLFQPDLALHFLIEAVSECPQSENSWISLAECYLMTSSFSDTEKALQNAIQCNPNSAKAWFLCGIAYRHLGRETEALECFNKMQQLGMTAAESYKILGWIFLGMNNLKEAEEYLWRSFMLNQEDPDTYLYMSIIARKRKTIDKAEQLLLKAIELRQNDAEYWYKLAVIYRHDKSDLHEAIRLYHKALFLDPERFDIWNDLGNAYKRVGELAKAEECLRKSMEIQPHHFRPFYNLACLAIYKGDREIFYDNFEKAFQLCPSRVCKSVLTDEELISFWNDAAFMHIYLKYCGDGDEEDNQRGREAISAF